MKINIRVVGIHHHTSTFCRLEKQPPMFIVCSHSIISLDSVQKRKIFALSGAANSYHFTVSTENPDISYPVRPWMYSLPLCINTISQLLESQHYVTMYWKMNYHLFCWGGVSQTRSFTFVTRAAAQLWTMEQVKLISRLPLVNFLFSCSKQESLCANQPKANQNKWRIQLYRLVFQTKEFSGHKHHRKYKYTFSRRRHAVAQLVEVAGSIPEGVIGIFRWYNPSGRIMALKLTQPLAEMSTRNISWGVKAAGA